MLNQAVLVGRLVSDPEIKETDKGSVSNITIAVPRTFKNDKGEYDTDFINCTLWKGIAENTVEYCKKGDLVGIKGRIQVNKYEDKDGEQKSSMQVVAERVTFLSNRAKTDHDRDER